MPELYPLPLSFITRRKSQGRHPNANNITHFQKYRSRFLFTLVVWSPIFIDKTLLELEIYDSIGVMYDNVHLSILSSVAGFLAILRG